jgi:sugar lactone lactonase YvrE
MYPEIVSFFSQGSTRRSPARFSRAILYAASIVCLLAGPAWGQHARVLVQGAPMVGGANGMFFDAAGDLYVANVFGQTLSRIDPETGEILEQLGQDDLAFFPDDVTVGPDGSLFWTDPAAGFVFRRVPAGVFGPDPVSFPVAAGFAGANPLTLSDDGRLFFAQCYNAPPQTNGIFEADPNGSGATWDVRTGDLGCASNGMDWWDGALYSPRPFEARVVRVDVDTGALTDVTTGWGVPVAVKFNSQGELHAVNQGNGEVVRIDLDTGARTLLAQLPVGWLDNLAFDASDRLFVSSFSDGTVLEVLEGGSLRTVSPGGMIAPMGLAVIGDVIYTGDPAALRGFDTATGAEVSVTRSVFGFGPLPATTSVAAWGSHVVLMSAFSGELVVWDPAAGSPVLVTAFALPGDAQPFQGDLVVTEIGSGQVVRASGPDLSVRETLATTFFPAGLAATEDDLYVSDAILGVVLQVVEDGAVLDPPKTVASGLVVPEGIALRPGGNRLLVVEGGTGSLKQVHLKSGKVKTLVTGLEFQAPIPGFTPTHWPNAVEVDEKGAVYVSADRDNVIFKLDDDEDQDE